MGRVDFLHGGNIYEIKRRYKKEVIDFSANINPLGLPSELKKSICNNFHRIFHYPDAEGKDVVQRIAKYWRIDEDNILLGNGSVELIYLVMSTYRPKTVLIPVPTFSEYERAAKMVKAKVRFLKLKPEDNFQLRLSCINRLESIFLCNPNNPTGNLILENPVGIKKTANRLSVIDEAFMDFLPDEKNYTLIWKAVEDKRIIVLRTLTKFFALPGLRMGYLIAHRDIVDKLKPSLLPWNTNSLAQLATERILDNKEYIKRTHEFIKKERRFLFQQLEGLKWLHVYPSVTNFLLLKIETPGLTSKSLKALLLNKGILIRDCSNFRGLDDSHIRVAIRSHGENLKLLAALKELKRQLVV